MAERIILDPAEEVPGRTEVDITPIMKPEGAQWPATTNAPYYADGEIGQVVIDDRWNNREVPIPLVLKDTAGTAFATWRSVLQAKVGEIVGSGGVLKRVTNEGTAYADIVSARLMLGGDWAQADRGYDINAQLELVLGPENYGPWRTLDVMRGTGEVVGVLREGGGTAAIVGDFPLGNRCRIVVTNTSAIDQRGLIAAFRGRHYDPAATAALAYEAEALTPLDIARRTIFAGASGGTVVQHTSLAASWTPVLGSSVGGTAAMTHQGVYRFFARLHSTSGAAVAARLVYDVGDLVFPSENSRWTFPDANQFYIADLGEVRLQRPPTADDYSWAWQIQAQGATGGESISADRVWLVPADEFMATAVAGVSSSRGLVPFTTHDEFKQAAGALNGKTLSGGGTWTVAGAGADFSVGTGAAIRSTTNESGTTGGKFALASGTGMVSQAASLDFVVSRPNSDFLSGLVLRYVDINNYFMLWYIAGTIGASKVVGGTFSLVMSNVPVPSASPAGAWQRLAAVVTADGLFHASLGPGEVQTYTFTGSDPALATGGALARGLAGIRDVNPGVSADDRYYDNFACWVPTADAILYATRAAELRTDGFYRQDATGTNASRVTPKSGNLPRLPQGTVELLTKQSRGDLDQLPDVAAHSLQVQVAYRACWLATPST